MQDDTSSLCRICNKQEETVDHIISGCPERTKLTTWRGTIRQLPISIGMRVSITKSTYQRGGMNISLRGSPNILWDMQLHTDRELSASKPDIGIKDHANRCCKLLISMFQHHTFETRRQRSLRKRSRNQETLRSKSRKCRK